MARHVKGGFYGVADVPEPPSPWPPAEAILLADRSGPTAGRAVFAYSYAGELAAPEPIVEVGDDWPFAALSAGFMRRHLVIREDPSSLVANMSIVRWSSGDAGGLVPPRIEVWDWYGVGNTYTWTGTSTASPNQRYEIGGVLWYDGWLWWVEYQGTFGNPNPPAVRLWKARANLNHDGDLPDEVGTESGPLLVRTVTSSVRLKVWQNVYLVPGWILICHSDGTTQPTHVIAIAMDGSAERAGTSSNYTGPNLAFKNDDVPVGLVPLSTTQFYRTLGPAAGEGRAFASGSVATIDVQATFADITETVTVSDAANSGDVFLGHIRPGGDLMARSVRIGDAGGSFFYALHGHAGPGINSRFQLDHIAISPDWVPVGDAFFPVEPT